MGKQYNTSDFLKYINSPLNGETINNIYEINGVEYELTTIFHDYIISLTKLIFKTYLGDDLTSKSDRKGHFNWCWNKTINVFNKENINIGNDSDLYTYFIEFMFDVFYSVSDKSDVLENNIIKLWTYMFNFNISKTKSDIDTFIEIYNLFKKSLKNI